MKARIYVCGPMRGRPHHNVPAFEQATRELREDGWAVVSPVDVGRLYANDPDVPGSEYLREDLLHLARCYAIALLPGWEASVGARCEVAVAITLGLSFYQPNRKSKFPNWRRTQPPSYVVVAGGYERPPGVVGTLDALAASEHDLEGVRRVEAWVQAGNSIGHPEHTICGLVGGRFGAVVRHGTHEETVAAEDSLSGLGHALPDADGVVEHVADGAA